MPELRSAENGGDSGALQMPPSPRGSVRQLLRDPLNFYLNLANEYGDVVCYRSAPETAFLVNHPDHVGHILVENHRNYTKGTYTNEMFKKAIADSLLVSEGDAWLRQRRLMQPAFHRQRLERLAPLFVREAAAVAERWREPARTGQPIDVAEEMAALTLSITTQALFGVSLGERVRAVGATVNMGFDLLEKPRHPRFQNALAVMNEVVDGIITERRQAENGKDDVLSRLLNAGEEIGEEGLSDRELRDQVITLLLAGYDTTANALTWTWFALAQQPEASARLRQELDQVLGDRQADVEDLPDLVYTHMVFNESMRLFPPAWILGRKALGEDSLGDFRVPAGTIIAISPYVLHRHPQFWDEPDAFDPERFSEQRSAGRHRYAFIPFGAGQRQCIGNNMALIEAQLIIAILAQSYDMSLLPGQSIQPDPLFVLRPNGKVLMKVARRSG